MSDHPKCPRCGINRHVVRLHGTDAQGRLDVFAPDGDYWCSPLHDARFDTYQRRVLAGCGMRWPAEDEKALLRLIDALAGQLPPGRTRRAIRTACDEAIDDIAVEEQSRVTLTKQGERALNEKDVSHG